MYFLALLLSVDSFHEQYQKDEQEENHTLFPRQSYEEYHLLFLGIDQDLVLFQTYQDQYDINDGR